MKKTRQEMAESLIKKEALSTFTTGQAKT